MEHLDHTDLALLRALQRDSQLTAQELSELLNLSASQIGRRRQRLESEGYITGYRARLSAPHLGLAVQAFVQVQTATHRPESHESFLRLARALPEVTAAWTLTGEADYLLRIWCSDLAALNDLIQNRLLPHEAVGRVQSQIVMDQIKNDAALPI